MAHLEKKNGIVIHKAGQAGYGCAGDARLGERVRVRGWVRVKCWVRVRGFLRVRVWVREVG